MSRASPRDALRGAGAKVPEAGLLPGSAGARVGSTDGALLHFFETEFDEWIAVSYLWRTKSEVRSGSWGGAGVGQDCRCTRSRLAQPRCSRPPRSTRGCPAAPPRTGDAARARRCHWVSGGAVCGQGLPGIAPSRLRQGVRDYLCNRAYSLGEARLERYLGQLVALVVACPSASLKRLLCDLCASSSRLACKVRRRTAARY